jgi:hypothetical protein
MTRTTLRSIAALGCAVILNSTNVLAQDNNLARTYQVVPKAGLGAQFEAALRTHIQWRMDNGDPWGWGVSTMETGDDFGDYSIRSGGHSYADFDAYDAGFNSRGTLHWQATVAPLIESMTSTISARHEAISKPTPAGTQLALVTVTKFQLRPGREQAFNRLITQAMDLVRDELPGYWDWASPVSGGGPGPYMILVGLNTSWSDMQEPDPAFAAIMARKLGQNEFEQWTQDVGETYRGVEIWTQRLRPDLRVTPAN